MYQHILLYYHIYFSCFVIDRYYITRAKLVSKIAKYPHVVSVQSVNTYTFTPVRCICTIQYIPLIYHA